MSLVHRYLQATFSVSSGGSAGSSKTFSNLRMSARITMANSAEGHLRLQIFGMTLEEMNALSYVPFISDQIGDNRILVQAGDPEHGMSTVFEGWIILAWPNMQNAPEVSFDVEAMYAVFNGAKPADPPWVSYSGSTDVAQIFSDIGKMHTPALTLENNGVNMKLDSPYFWGSPRNMLAQLGKMTRVGWVEDTGNRLCIWPHDKARNTGGTAVISAATGMVGYPAAVPGYIVVKKLFDRPNPYGSKVTIQSDIKKANGTWTVWQVLYELDNYLMPHNRWFATLFCSFRQAPA